MRVMYPQQQTSATNVLMFFQQHVLRSHTYQQHVLRPLGLPPLCRCQTVQRRTISLHHQRPFCKPVMITQTKWNRKRASKLNPVHILLASWTLNPHSQPGKMYKKPKRNVSHAGYVDGFMMVEIAVRITTAQHATTFYVPNLKRIVLDVGSTGADSAAR